jgi:hypothetical protein
MGECLCVKTKPLPFEELGVDIERGRNMSHGVPPLISAGIIVGSYHRDIFVAQRAVKARSRRPYGEAPTNFPRRLEWLVGPKIPCRASTNSETFNLAERIKLRSVPFATSL